MNTVSHWCWQNCKCQGSIILSDSRSSDAPGAELRVRKPPSDGGLNQIVFVLILSQCSLLYRPDTGEDMTLPLHCLRNKKIVSWLFFMTIQTSNQWICPRILTCARCKKVLLSAVSSISSVHQACVAGFSAQTDESLCIPFIKEDVRCLTVPGLEVKYKEYKHGDHTAGCRPAGWLLKVLLYPASHTQTKTWHLLCQLTTWDVSLCWQKKRDPLLDQEGWVLVPVLPLQHITSVSTTSSIFYNPTPIFKEGRALPLAPGSHHLSNRLYLCDSVLARHLVWGQSTWGPLRLAGIVHVEPRSTVWPDVVEGCHPPNLINHHKSVSFACLWFTSHSFFVSQQQDFLVTSQAVGYG